MDFVNSLGVLIIIICVVVGVGHAVRRRGAIARWLNNIEHEDNADEKADEIIRLQRDKEDIERRLEKLREN